jgi:hypothetical protein
VGGKRDAGHGEMPLAAVSAGAPVTLRIPVLCNNSAFIALDANPRSKDNSQGLNPIVEGHLDSGLHYEYRLAKVA